MKRYKPDSICNECYHKHPYYPHKCTYTVALGDFFDSPKSGRYGLAKDGASCKYFYKRKGL